MRTAPFNKMLGTIRTKLSGDAERQAVLQAVFDAKVANLSLSADEAHRVGYAVAQAAEEVERAKPYRVAMRQATVPTADEAHELDAAIAVWEGHRDRLRDLNARDQRIEQELRDLHRDPNWDDRAPATDDEERELRRLQAERLDLVRQRTIVLAEQELAEGRISEARSAIDRGVRARSRRVVETW